MKLFSSSILLLATFCLSALATDNSSSGVAFDYDGDAKADLAVRRNSNFFQYISNSSDLTIARRIFGRQASDVPVRGDFDGDGIYDIAIRRPSNQTWYIVNSSGVDALTNHADGISRVRFGRDMADIPVPADYDGDGKTDLAVRRPGTQFWYIHNSSGVDSISGYSDGISRIRFGLQAADIPVPADYDGDGKADIAVRRPSSQLWYIRNSTGEDALTGHDDGISRVRFGRQTADIPVVADFDGDGKADIAVRRPDTFQWFVKNSSGIDPITSHDDGISRVRFGRDSNDIPVIADYDGDGKADIAVRRPTNQTWYLRNSSGLDARTGHIDGITRARFGLQIDDIPLAQPLHLLWLKSDIDNDGLSNQQEAELGTDITNADSDNDGLTDGEEVNEHQTNPLNADSDGDGVSDGDEVGAGTDPNTADNDNSGNAGPFSFTEDKLAGLKVHQLRGAPHTEEQLQRAWWVWYFNENQRATSHFAEDSFQNHFDYQIESANRLQFRSLTGLYQESIECYLWSTDHLAIRRLEVFGERVFGAIYDACSLGLFPNDTLHFSYGEIERHWDLKESSEQTFTVESTITTRTVLELPETILESWPDDIPTSIESVSSVHTIQMVYQNEEVMPELLSAGLNGSWVMPIDFIGSASDDNNELSAGFLHDQVAFTGQQASSLHSNVDYEVTLSETSFSMQQGEQTLVYTPIKQLSDNFQVLIEHYRDGVMYDVYMSMMVKVNSLDGGFLSSASTELPQAYVTLLHPNSIYDEQIPLSDLQAYHLKGNGDAKSINYNPQWRETVFSFDSDYSWHVLNDSELLIETPYSQGLIRRHWQVIDVTSSGQAIVLEYQVNARGQFEGGEFVATSQRFIERPRLNVVSKIDLSQYGDIWNHTDFDRDGLTNQFEAALGTDIDNRDTDNDSYSDYAEWRSGSDPTDSQSVPVLLGDIEFADENFLNCLLSNHETQDMAYKVQFVACHNRNITSLSGIEYLPALDFLALANNNITDLTPLSGMTSLETLQLDNNPISDLAPLSALTNLRVLLLEDTGLQSIEGLEGLTSLEELDLENNNIRDLSPLAELSNLTFLDLSSNGLSDLSSISGLPNLATLILSYNNIVDVVPLSRLVSLRTLYLGFNQVVNVAALNSLSRLTYISLFKNNSAICDEIDDLERDLHPVDIRRPEHCPVGVGIDETLITDSALLACIQSYSIQWIEELTELKCERMDIEAIDGLEQFFALNSLSLSGNDITSINALSALTALSYLDLSYNNLTDVTPLTGLLNLEDLRLIRNKIVDIAPFLALQKLTSLNLIDNKIEDISVSQQLVNLRQLYLSGNAIRDISGLSSLSKLERLELSENQIVTIDALSSLEFLGTLELNNNQISDITALQSLSSLYVLDLAGNQIQDISPIASLRWVNILYINNNEVSDISPLATYFRLYHLDISDNPITDISAVDSMIGLSELSMARIDVEPDWTIINGIENLRYLDISGSNISDLSGLNPSSTSFSSLLMDDNQITDISPLNSITNLGRLSVNNNQLSDITPLSEMSRIYELNIANNNISDITMIGDLTRLRILNLGDNPITDISPLGAMTGLSTLDISGLALDDLSALSPLTGLFRLRANNNSLSDLSSLASLTGLVVLYTDANQISDVSAVNQLTNLRVLSLNNNMITDVSTLSDDLVILYLAQNQIADVTPFYEMQSLSVLDVSNNPDINCEVLAQLREQLGSTEVRSSLACQN